MGLPRKLPIYNLDQNLIVSLNVATIRQLFIQQLPSQKGQIEIMISTNKISIC